MLTLPAAFDLARHRQSSDACLFLRLDPAYGGGFETIWAGEKALQLGNANIKPWLMDISPITCGLDFNTMAYQTGRVDVILTNAPLMKSKSSHRWLSIIDSIVASGGLWHAGGKLYWYPGGHAVSVTDCLMVFWGRVVNVIVEANERLRLQIDEQSTIFHRTLPQRRMNAVDFPKAPGELMDDALPLHYGNRYESVSLRATGAAPGLQMDDWKWLIADHVCKAFYYDWPLPNVTLWVYFEKIRSWGNTSSDTGIIGKLNDAGRTTLSIGSPTARSLMCHVYPCAGGAAAYDYDTATYQSVAADSATTASIIFEWDQQGSEANDAINNDVAEIYGGASCIGLMLYALVESGVTISTSAIDIWTGAAWTEFASSISFGSFFEFYNFEPAYYWTSATNGIFWHLNTGPKGGDGTRTKIRIRLTGSGWTVGQSIARVCELYIRVTVRLPSMRDGLLARYEIPGGIYPNRKAQRRGTGYEKGNRVGPLTPAFRRLGVSISGRMFGSWIDNPGRTNSYIAGDLINNAAGVIESLLRDELGCSSINESSFDALYNLGTLPMATLTIDDRTKADSRDIIERLCYEHSLFLFRRSDGNWKLIDGCGSGAAAVVLRPEHLLGRLPRLATTEYGAAINQIHYQYRRMPDDGKYLKSSQVDDATAQSVYGVNIGDDEHVSTIYTEADLVRLKGRQLTTYCMASRPHALVSFITIGPQFAGVELGDSFAFDSTAFDDLTTMFGKSWLNQFFMVYEKAILKHGIEWKCINWQPLAIS